MNYKLVCITQSVRDGFQIWKIIYLVKNMLCVDINRCLLTCLFLCLFCFFYYNTSLYIIQLIWYSSRITTFSNRSLIAKIAFLFSVATKSFVRPRLSVGLSSSFSPHLYWIHHTITIFKKKSVENVISNTVEVFAKLENYDKPQRCKPCRNNRLRQAYINGSTYSYEGWYKEG